MRQAPRLTVVLRSPDFAHAAASWGPLCAEPGAANFGGLTIAPTGARHASPKANNCLAPLLLAALARR